MNNSFRKTRGPFMNFIRVITLWAFLFNTVGPQILIEPAAALDTVNSTLDFNVQDIQIPLSFGEIKETIQGTNDNTVIHIQDAHCNYSAQHSISDIIHHLSENYGVDLIMLEGGKGSYDLSVFTKIGDLDIRNRVSDYFVKEGRVSGAEFFAINNPNRIKLFGIEDENLYMANLNAYRKSLNFKKEADSYLNTVFHIINNFKRKIYSSELSDLDETIKRYKEKNTDFKEYVTTLSNRAQSLKINLSPFENITSLSRIIKEEKDIDFKEANKERGVLVGKLEAKLSKLEMEHLVRMTIDFKKQNITNEDFYAYLFKKARFANVDFTSLPNLVKYSEYVKKYEKIDKGNLFREIRVLEDALMKSLIKTDDQKTLYVLDKNLSVMKDMFNVSLIKEEYDYYKANRDSFNTEHFLKFIETKGPLYKFDFNVDTAITKLDSFRKDMEKFYACSLKRDNAFIKNMESKLKKENKRVTILVTGGFHTGNLKNILRDKGYSYIEVMPRMDIACVENNPYFHLLSGGKSQMETLVETSILNSNISPIHMLSEMGITGSRNGKNLYELAIDVKKALEVDAKKGIVLMVPGGYLRLTHEPESEFYEKIGEIDGKAVYAQREENEVYDTDIENVVIVEFDRNKLTYNGHQSVVDLLLKTAHAPNQTRLEAHSLKDFLISLTPFCDIMIDKIGGDNVLKLMDICDREFGNSKRFIHVITGKDKSAIAWRIGSYSDNYGVNVAYTGDKQKFIEYLLHELNRAANSGLEHIDNNIALEREAITSMLNKIEMRLDNRIDNNIVLEREVTTSILNKIEMRLDNRSGDFAASEMPKMLKVSDDIASLPREGLESFEKFYHYLMQPKFESNVELNLDKLVKMLKIREADKKAFKAWVEVLKDRTKSIWGLHHLGFLSNSAAQEYAIEMIVEYERYKQFTRADFAANEMPDSPVLLKDETRERILARIKGKIPEIMDASFDVVSIFKKHSILKEKTLNEIDDNELYTLIVDEVLKQKNDYISGARELKSIVRSLLLDEKIQALSRYVKFYMTPGDNSNEAKIIVQNPNNVKDSIEFVLDIRQGYNDEFGKIIFAILRGMPDERTSAYDVFQHINDRVFTNFSLKKNSLHIPRKQILFVKHTAKPDLSKAMETVDDLLQSWVNTARADFAAGKMPEDEDKEIITKHIELRKKAVRDYVNTAFGYTIEVKIEVEIDKGYQAIRNRKCFLANIDEVKKQASCPAELERILGAIQSNIETKIIDETNGYEYKFKGGFRSGKVMALLIRAEDFNKIKTFGKEIRLILPASVIDIDRTLVQDYVQKDAHGPDFAAAEMPDTLLDNAKVIIRRGRALNFEYTNEQIADAIKETLRRKWKSFERLFLKLGGDATGTVIFSDGREFTVEFSNEFGRSGVLFAIKNSTFRFIGNRLAGTDDLVSGLIEVSRADFAAAEMPAKHMTEMLKESGFQELAKGYFFNGKFFVHIFEDNGKESLKDVFVSALGPIEECDKLMNICINPDEFTCPSLELFYSNGKKVIREISSGSQTTRTEKINADLIKSYSSVSFKDQLVRAGFYEIRANSGIFELTLGDTKAIVICKNNKILFIGKKVNKIDSKNNPRLIRYEQVKSRYSEEMVDCFKIQAGQVTYNLNPSGDLTFFSLDSSRELPIELSKEQTYIEEPDSAGFAIGGVNTNETIDKLTELAGVPIEVIEKRAQPRNYSDEGFLAKGERFKDVLKRDNTEIFSKGFTHQELAEPLFYAMNLSHEIGASYKDVVEFLYRGKKYLVHSAVWMGDQESIFNDRLLASKDFVVRNVETKKEVLFSELVPYYIWRYGFYEGDTDYRVNPLDIIEVFFSERISRADFASAEMPTKPVMGGDIASGIHIDGKLQPLGLQTDYEKEELKTALLNVLSEAFKTSTRNLFDGAPLMVSLPINSEVSGVTIEEVAGYMASVQGVRVEADKKAVEFKVPGANVTYYLFEDNDIGRAKLLTKLEEKQSEWRISNDEMKRQSIVYSFAKDIQGITDKAFTVYLEGEIEHGKYRTPTPLARCIAASIKVFNLFDLTRPDRPGITESDIKIATEDAARGIISISGLSLSEMTELVNDLIEKITKVGLFALSGKLFIKIRPVNWNDLIKFHEIEREVLRAV